MNELALVDEDWTVPTALVEEPGPPHNATLITWRERDWYWLSYFKEWCRLYPDDYITKQIYKNYIRWYRTKGEISYRH